MQYARTVIGYHGCDLHTAEGLLRGQPFHPSTNDYDWLGHGIYFWEFGPDRAWRFALEQAAKGRIQTPAVVGALIQLGQCFDLLDTRFTHDLREFHGLWKGMMELSGALIPVNRGSTPERKGRYLDCAVINEYLGFAKRTGTSYDAVRGVFVEGEPVYDGAGFHLESHIQLSVRNPGCILGVFQPLNGGDPGGRP